MAKAAKSAVTNPTTYREFLSLDEDQVKILNMDLEVEKAINVTQGALIELKTSLANANQEVSILKRKVPFDPSKLVEVIQRVNSIQDRITVMTEATEGFLV